MLTFDKVSVLDGLNTFPDSVTNFQKIHVRSPFLVCMWALFILGTDCPEAFLWGSRKDLYCTVPSLKCPLLLVRRRPLFCTDLSCP